MVVMVFIMFWNLRCILKVFGCCLELIMMILYSMLRFLISNRNIVLLVMLVVEIMSIIYSIDMMVRMLEDQYLSDLFF